MSALAQHTIDVGALPLLDTAMIEALRSALGPGTDALVERARGVIDDRLEKLEALGLTPLDDGFARLAHEIGGVAGQIGLTRLAQAALALERLSRGGDCDAASAALDALLETAEASRAALLSA